MAVEYEISSDVAVIKETGSVSQCARVTQMYSGQITYDDEAGSKFATATINGKSQRVMLCIAVNGTVNYDDVPSLYSTVDGHRCLNIVTPTETGTPDDVPSLYETVVIDGQNVRAVRCIMINKTPVYDGVSSTCTFTGDDGKTHTAQLVNKITGGSVVVIIKGTSPLNLPDAIANSLSYVKAFGGTEQRNIPQPYTQVNYVTNTAQTAVNTGIMIDFAKNYEFEVECRAVSGSWYILQSRASASGNVTGIHGETSGSNIKLVVGNVTVCTSAITRTVGNKLYVKATLNAGTATLYVKDETANTEDTQTGSYGTTQPNPTAAVYLLGNAGEQYVDVNSDIYMARIKENGVTVMDYVPARQVATAGFYDKASGTFKTAETPANLSADGNTVPTPDAPMDIVSNNGVLKVSPNLFDKNASYALFNGFLNNASVGQNTTLSAYAGGDKTIIIKVAPNTTYTVTRATNLGSVYDRIRCAAFTTLPSGGSTGVMLYNLSQNTQQANATFTTLSDTQYVAINVRNTGAVGDDWTQFVDAFQLEKGSTATPYMPYGQIYADGPVETINAHGKNLFNGIVEQGGLGDSGGIETVSSVRIRTTAVSVKPNTTYNVSWATNSEMAVVIRRVHFYDASNTWISSIAATTFTTPPDTAFIRFVLQHSTLTDDITPSDISNVQLELGSTATTYEPYYDGGTATAEMLLKVGDYQDEQEILSGTVTRNVGAKVLDGTENWSRATNQDGSANYVFYTQIDEKKIGISMPMLCTHYVYVGSASYVTLTTGKFLSNSANTSVYFDGGSITTTTNWKNWLADQYAAGTPVIIIYPLATPTTESVTGQTLQVTDGDNVLEITQAGLTGLELEAEYQAAVSLTIQEVQDANLDNNVEVTIS